MGIATISVNGLVYTKIFRKSGLLSRGKHCESSLWPCLSHVFLFIFICSCGIPMAYPYPHFMEKEFWLSYPVFFFFLLHMVEQLFWPETLCNMIPPYGWTMVPMVEQLFWPLLVLPPFYTCVIALRWWWLLKVAAIPWCRVQEMVLWDGYCHP